MDCGHRDWRDCGFGFVERIAENIALEWGIALEWDRITFAWDLFV